MQAFCRKDPSGKGEHIFSIDIDSQRGIKKCSRCGQWNIQGNNWTKDEDFK